MSVYKRKDLQGGHPWRAVVRIKGYPTISDSFARKQEALDWEHETKKQIKSGQFNFNQHKNQYRFNELVERYVAGGELEHHRSAKDTIRHLDYWKNRLGSYALMHLTSELIAQERQHLLNTPTGKGKKRSSATVNRYFASLSSCLSFASKQLRWTQENPCLNLRKLKENSGRERVLSPAEVARLLEACKDSNSPYLYCIVLIAMTTGARQGEILNLEWHHVNFDTELAYLKETKNGRPRSIALEHPVLEELKKFYANRDSSKSLVFASKTAFGRIDIKKSWATALERAEIQDCRFHDMRHTFATYVATLGASNLEIQVMTGHRTLQMLQRYTHLEGQMTRKFNKTISEKITGGFQHEKV